MPSKPLMNVKSNLHKEFKSINSTKHLKPVAPPNLIWSSPLERKIKQKLDSIKNSSEGRDDSSIWATDELRIFCQFCLLSVFVDI